MNGLFNKLADGLKKAVTDAGYSKAVLGLSGGVDSAVAAAIACEALEPENVNLFYLPYTDENPHTFPDVKAVADFLETSLVYMDISRVAGPYFDSLINPTTRRKNNVLSRIRMVVLFDQSALYNALVIGSVNKSEIMLGSVTLFGDGAYAVNPLGSIYKTEVWQLAKEIGLPDTVTAQTPDKAFFVGGTEDNEIVFPYEQVDRLLPILEASGFSVEEAVKAGFEREFAEKAVKLIKTSEFKRRASIILER
jgi:NAD+ synthase